jgi:hypothetical protein
MKETISKQMRKVPIKKSGYYHCNERETHTFNGLRQFYTGGLETICKLDNTPLNGTLFSKL